MLAFLGFNEKGEYQLFVSAFPISVAGSRLEKGRPFPDAVRALTEKPKDPETAIKALGAMAGFLNGSNYGVALLEFGVDALPLLGRKKK